VSDSRTTIEKARVPTRLKRAKPEPKAPITILDACRDPNIFGPWFKNQKSWAAWFVFLAAVFGLELADEELAVFHRFTDRTAPLPGGYLEATLIIGRRGGKSLILALIAAYLACFFDWGPYLTGGERGTIMIIAADRKQARAIFRYLKGMLSIPLLAGLVTRETQESIDLSNGITIEILAANFKTVRSYTIVACLADEESFWSTDEGLANPDVEIINAIRPAMATIPRAMLLKASSPYARRGDLFDDFRKYYGQNDARVLVWKASTRDMNPSVPQSFIDREYERDAAHASAEYGGEFRSDVESFVNREAVEACLVEGRFELPPVSGIEYSAFVDPSGGSADSMTLAITHREGDKVIVDAVREHRPPFSPESVVSDHAKLLKSYRIAKVHGDYYAGQWPRERFEQHGITYIPSGKVKSDLYRDLLPLVNGRRIELLDHPKSINQLCALERKTARSGKDSIDHPPKQHDDVINAIAGAAVHAHTAATRMFFATPFVDSAPSYVGSFEQGAYMPAGRFDGGSAGRPGGNPTPENEARREEQRRRLNGT
jgi:hypothetical protein